MALCLANISGLGKKSASKVRLVDAGWIWTEPHSMRLKVRLTIQKEVQEGTILQQSFTVIFVVRNQQCIECQAEFRQGVWKSLVQVRQRVGHKRTFLYLEQLILKHGAHRGCLSIETFRDGMDFYFPDRGKAARFICFLEGVVPIRVKTSRKLIGIDDKSNTANYKFTNFVEICPLCKDDLLYLPAKLARTLGNIPRIVLVKNISSLIHLIDPLSGQTASMSGDQYWREPLRPIITAARSRLTRYVVLGKEPLVLKRNVSRKVATRKNRSKLAIVTMAKEEDLGVNDAQFEEQSHVGYLMKSGDVCLGYDLTETQFVDDDAEALRDASKLPSVIVVRKLYGGVATNDTNAAKMRVWKLQRLDVQVAESLRAKTVKKDAELDDIDEEDFMREVEADADMRKGMNLYKSEVLLKMKDEDVSVNVAQEMAIDVEDDDDDEDDQQIKLDELLDNLVLDDAPDESDEFIPENTAMMGEDEAWEAATQFYTEGAKAAKDGLSYVPRDHANQIRDKESAVSISRFSKQFLAEDNDKKAPK
jgi:nonsense-mediated mRNA decay protein 3